MSKPYPKFVLQAYIKSNKQKAYPELMHPEIPYVGRGHNSRRSRNLFTEALSTCIWDTRDVLVYAPSMDRLNMHYRKISKAAYKRAGICVLNSVSRAGYGKLLPPTPCAIERENGLRCLLWHEIMHTSSSPYKQQTG